MTFQDVFDEYNAQFKRACESYDEYRAGKTQDYFKLNYMQIDVMLMQAAQDTFGFTFEQARYVHGEAHSRLHSSYSDMPLGMSDLCEFVIKFPGIKF